MLLTYQFECILVEVVDELLSKIVSGDQFLAHLQILVMGFRCQTFPPNPLYLIPGNIMDS